MRLHSDVLNVAQARLDRAKEIFAVLAGKDGFLEVVYFAQYIVLIDEFSRSLVKLEEYQDALDGILTDCVENGKYMDNNGIADAYSDICGEAPALYSTIGEGEFNKDVDGLASELRKTMPEGTVEDVLRALGIKTTKTMTALDFVNTNEKAVVWIVSVECPAGREVAWIGGMTELPFDLSEVEGEVTDGVFDCTNLTSGPGIYDWNFKDCCGSTVTNIEIYVDEKVWDREYADLMSEA